ncbi:hypothetical protein ACFLTD_04765 [Elusimicrobiota bacterium]
MIIKIAGLPVKLSIKDLPGKVSKDVYSRYAGFRRPDEDKYVHEVIISGLPVRKSTGRIVLNKEKNKWVVRGRGMDVRVNKKMTRGSVVPDIHIIDSLLRIIYSFLLVRDRGFLIHAGGAASDIYTGPSGSGKTTSVRDLDNITNDDVVALKKEEDRWYVFSTPFSGEYPLQISSLKFILKKIYILKLKKGIVAPSVVLKNLLKNTVYFFSDRYGMSLILRSCADLSSSVSAYGFKR